MDAYLSIAAAILKRQRRPLSPRAILTAAYQTGMVPSHLHGKAQHKTLQARLSEDIVTRRDQSLFFRTAPGRFFLREFLADASVPDEFRRQAPTRRRFRELVRGPALAIECDALERSVEPNRALQPDEIYRLLRTDHYRYDDPRDHHDDVVFLRSFVCVMRETQVLTYRLGRYRDDRDTFMSKRSIGFTTHVHCDEHDLFNLGDFGIVDAGVRATKIDLDIPDVPATSRIRASLSHFVWAWLPSGISDLLGIIAFSCPPWFEPVKRRLALNDLSWMDLNSPVNDIDDFDPWSKIILSLHYEKNAQLNGEIIPKNKAG